MAKSVRVNEAIGNLAADIRGKIKIIENGLAAEQIG